MEMEIVNGNGNAPIAGARYCARHRVEMVLCAAMEEGTESSPIDLEDWRAVGLAESCASNPIVLDDEDSFASSGSDFE